MTRAPLRSFIGFEKEAEIVVAGRIGSILRRMEGDTRHDSISREKVLYCTQKKSKMNFEMGYCQSRNMSECLDKRIFGVILFYKCLVT